MFDYTTESEFCALFRKGEIDIDKLPMNKDEKDFLREFEPNKNDPPKISSEFTREQLMKGFKIWPERTSTSPSGRHLGLYKVWLHKEKGEAVEEEVTPEYFFDMLLLIIGIAMKHRVPLKRWKTVHNLFLLKEPGNYKIHRLRFLHKLDAELNLIRREFISRRLMKHAEKHHLLSDEQ